MRLYYSQKLVQNTEKFQKGTEWNVEKSKNIRLIDKVHDEVR